MSALRVQLRSERGIAVPFIAITLVVLVASASFTVDLGRVMLRGRDLQLVADVAALDASRVLDQRPASAQHASVEAAAVASAARNGFATGADRSVAVSLGTVGPDGEFVAITAPSIEVPNAVNVRVVDTVPYLLSRGGRTTSRDATATAAARGRVELGTGVLGDDGECSGGDAHTRNSVLGALLGVPLSLDAVGYQGLACARTTLGDLALAAGLGRDVDALLGTDLTVPELLDLAARALELQPAGGQTAQAIAAIGALRSAAQLGLSVTPISLGDLIRVTTGTASQYADVAIGLGTLVDGAIFLGRDGAVVTVPGLGVSLGLLSLSVRAGVVEPPQVVIGPMGSSVRTAQVRLRITADVVDLPPLTRVHLPLVVDVASAEATLVSVECVGGQPTGAGVHVRTAPVQIAIGTVADGALGAPGPAQIIGAPVVTLLGQPIVTSSYAIALEGADTVLQIDTVDIGKPVRVSGPMSAGFDGSLLVAGLPVGAVVAAVLSPTLGLVLSTVVDPLLAVFGLHVGYADVIVSDLTCPKPRLIS